MYGCMRAYADMCSIERRSASRVVVRAPFRFSSAQLRTAELQRRFGNARPTVRSLSLPPALHGSSAHAHTHTDKTLYLCFSLPLSIARPLDPSPAHSHANTRTGQRAYTQIGSSPPPTRHRPPQHSCCRSRSAPPYRPWPRASPSLFLRRALSKRIISPPQRPRWYTSRARLTLCCCRCCCRCCRRCCRRCRRRRRRPPPPPLLVLSLAVSLFLAERFSGSGSAALSTTIL
jgi:hypothetical protein